MKSSTLRTRVVARIAARRAGEKPAHAARARVTEEEGNSRRFLIALLAIAAGALVLRLISLAELRSTPLLDVLLGDARAYDAWAQQIAAGKWTGIGSFYQSPLYPYLMGLVFKVTGHHVFLVRVLQGVCGATSCALLGLAGRRFFDERAGLAAAALLAVYPPAIFFDILIQKSSLDGLFLTSILAALGACAKRPRLRMLAVLGLALGLLMLNRENARALYPISLAWLLVGFRAAPFRMRLRWAGIVTAGAALVLVPVAIRNYYAGGEFFLSTSQLGPNLYIGNHADAPGTYDGLVPDRGSVEFEQADATTLAEAARGRKLTPGEVSDYWTGQVFDYVRSHPWSWLRLMARKLNLTFHARESVDTESIEAYAEHSNVLRLLSWFNFGVVLGLATLGAWLTRRDWRRLAVLYAVIGGLAVSVAVFYVMARYRYPIAPVLLLFGAAALTAIPNFRVASARRWLPGLILGLLAAVYSHLPAKLPGDNTKVNLGSELLRLGRSPEAVPILRQAIAGLPDYAPAHFSLALALDDMDQKEEAIAEYETTVRLWPGDFQAREALALSLQEAGRTTEALDNFREASRLEPESAPAQNNLAMALHQAGNPAEAIPHYEAAIALTPGYALAHSNLALALVSTGRSDEAVSHFAEALRLEPDNADIRLNLGNLLVDMNRTAEAVAQYEQAVSLMPQSIEAQSRLAEAYMSAGRFQNARERFNAAIAIARDAGDTEAVRRLTDSIENRLSGPGRRARATVAPP